MIRIAIIDDQPIVRQGLAMVLGSEKDIEVVAKGGDGFEAIEICSKNCIDVMLMDIKMPSLNGVEATRKIKEQHSNVKIIILTTFNEDEYIFEALKYGASGYLLKDALPEKIAEAIRIVYNGGAQIQPDVAVKVVEKFKSYGKKHEVRDKRIEDLTEREIDIIRCVGEGKSNREIAKELFISEGTVKNHITNILNKLSLRDRTQLAIFSINNNLV
ncbi:response regulator transcription factor [Alkaliphilus sp. B6464]|uniref:response regulator transcription factor n=1 Tax=Alkaliphilus sp. B6464 TaxID=2731219 RepID=UPI001BADDAF2|nr:response regulator transcription factor [Alkaliphilus sp. B6464]QUH19123.1 response regulator transcription factor [Alkaliphilus sp. B6464]